MRQKHVLIYVLLVGLPLAGVVAMLQAGRALVAPSTAAMEDPPTSFGAASAAGPAMPNLLLLVTQLAVIILFATVVAVAFQKIRQPKVIGEMFAGIMLGPSLLGWIAPGVSASLFPPDSMGYLNALSQVGVVLYMFLVGLALDTKKLRQHGHTAVLGSHASIVAPFLLGTALALYLYPRLSNSSVGFSGFALFMGAAMSITAFPVLARILTQRGMLGTKLGSLAITCAAVDDVTGWCILAYIVLTVRSSGEAGPSLWMTLGGLAVFLVLMLSVVKKLLVRFETAFKAKNQLTENSLALMLLVVLFSAIITEKLGLHLLFGSFLAGAVAPKDKKFVRYVMDRFESTTVVLLLPLYFAFTGLRTSIQLIQAPGMWTICVLIILTAIAGKLGGSMIAARFAGSTWRESAALGVLMNTRGLMELVILNIGLDIGVISPSLFSMMVLMALVTTFMTAPLFEWIYPKRLIREEINGDENETAAYDLA